MTRRFAIRPCLGRRGCRIGILLLLGTVPVLAEGYHLMPEGMAVDRAEHWQAWDYPRHAVVVDSSTHGVQPTQIRQPTDAIEHLKRFQVKIGDPTAYDKLIQTLTKDHRPIPLNIRAAPARVAGVPIVHRKDDPRKGIREGDPLIWYYYHGGIREAPTNPEWASHILDGDPATYWEPGSVVSWEAYATLPEEERGPIYYFIQEDTGRERRAEVAEYEQAAPDRRRIEYHSRSLKDWYVEVDLGRVVPVSRIVLRFVEEGRGEPFRQVRLLGSSSHGRNASLSLIARTYAPNEDRRVVEFKPPPDRATSFRQLHRLRIAVTESKFDRFRKVSRATYQALPQEQQGSVEYYLLNALGGEIQVDPADYERAGPDRQGRRVYYQRERPRLADIEVWTQGDNVALGVLDSGGDVELPGALLGPDAGFDGLFDTDFTQNTWLPDTERSEIGSLTLDLGGVFWLNHIRMVMDCCFRGGEVEIRTSDGTRDARGEPKWGEVVRCIGDGDANLPEGYNIEKAFEDLIPVRFLRTRFFQPEGYHRPNNYVREFQLFGQGFVPEVVLTSPLIELPEAVLLGAIKWEVDLPDPAHTRVEIRTRTGNRLIEETRYYGRGGYLKTASEYHKLPRSFQGPIVTHQIPGSGWSPWSPPYRRSGAAVLSPSPRKYLQIQVKLRSDSPELAPTIRSLRVGFQPPVAHQVRAEIWPDQVFLGVPQTFTCYLNPTFVAARPDGSPSTRFDELRLDATPIEAIRLVDVSLGSETAFRQDTASCFREIGRQVDPISGTRTPWFTDETGRQFQALIDPEAADTLKVWQGAVVGLEKATGGPVLQLQFPRKIALLPEGTEERIYNRVILDERDQVPVDENGRRLNEILYLNLPAEKQGRILHFAITGREADGTAIQDSASKGEYWALPDSLRGEIRYFRTGIGGEFPFDRSGDRLTEEAYDRLDPSEQGAVLASGQLVRVRFQGKVVLHGTTIDAAIRDAQTLAVWQPVDAGEATALTPGSGLSIAVPFSRRILHHVTISPNPFTPNGDGINDRTEIHFDLGKLNQAREIQVEIYDLSGRRVWQEQQEGYGSSVFVWDGRDDAGVRVPPGLYVCKVSVGVDANEARRTTISRVVAVAY